MNQFDDHIREGMAEGEKLPTDLAVVYNRVEELSQVYRTRRRIAQSAGGAVLGVGLMVGLVQMHGFVRGGVEPSPAVTSAAPAEKPTEKPTEEPPPEKPPERTELDAYFGAGYNWTDAEKLARLWNIKDPGEAKVVAGRRLLNGERLPIDP